MHATCYQPVFPMSGALMGRLPSFVQPPGDVGGEFRVCSRDEETEAQM